MTSLLPVGTLGTNLMPFGIEKGNYLPLRGGDLQAVGLFSRNFNHLSPERQQLMMGIRARGQLKP